MPPKSEHSPSKSDKQSQHNSESQDYYCEGLEEQVQISDPDEEQLLNAIKIQRKRIEQLLQERLVSQQKIKSEVEKNKQLQEELSKFTSIKSYQSEYNQIATNYELSIQDNRKLKEQICELKHEIQHLTTEKNNIIQKLRLEINILQSNQNAKIDQLQEDLDMKTEQIERMQREQRYKDKEYNESINSYKNRIVSIQTEQQNFIKNEEKKRQKLEKDIKCLQTTQQQADNNAEVLLKENVQLREDNFRMYEQLNSKQNELATQAQKFKLKVSAHKRQLKAKEKEVYDYRQTVKKYQRQASQKTSEVSSHLLQIRRLKQTYENERNSWKISWQKQKQNLEQLIKQQSCHLEELQNKNRLLLEDNEKLHVRLRKFQKAEKQRKNLLRNEMREVEKLQRVIDKIVE